MRIRAGWLVALAYLFCVLAPGAALAWGNGPAPCLTSDVQMVGLTAQHHHDANDVHGHSMHGHHHAAAQDAPTGHHHDDKGAPGPCCAMMCVSALPADLPDVAKPMQPISACTPDVAVSLHSEAPPRLYRPPIA